MLIAYTILYVGVALAKRVAKAHHRVTFSGPMTISRGLAAGPTARGHLKDRVEGQEMAGQPDFDVFLSYSASDKSTVLELATALKARGIKVWFDEWELVPGRPWQDALERQIRSVRSAAVTVGPTGIGPWEEPEMRACLSEFVRRRLPVIPVLLPGAPSNADLPMFLAQFTWVDMRGGITPSALERLQWGITGIKQKVGIGNARHDDRDKSLDHSPAPEVTGREFAARAQGVPEPARIRYEIVFSGDFAVDNDGQVNSLLMRLQRVAEDSSLRIARRRVDSLHLTVEGLRSGFVRLLMLYRGGELSRRLGRPVSFLRRWQLVILLHGIRTRAEWQRWIRSLLEEDEITVVEPCSYGFFSAVGLFLPFPFRQMSMSVVQSKLRDAVSRHESEQREVIVIAHSFGTYIITQILRNNPDLKVDRVLFCGSIVRENYRWDQLPNRPEQVLNEAGSRDIWPILARSCSWGYGASGTFGFMGYGVEDRFHNLKHSDYFKPGFAEKYWKPWVHDNELTRTQYEKRHRPPTPFWKSLLAWLPLQWIGIGFVVIVLVAALWRHWHLSELGGMHQSAPTNNKPAPHALPNVIVLTDPKSYGEKRRVPLNAKFAISLQGLPADASVTWSHPVLGTLNRFKGANVVYHATELGGELLVARIVSASMQVDFETSIDFQVDEPFRVEKP